MRQSKRQYNSSIKEALFAIFIALLFGVVLIIPKFSSDIFVELILMIIGLCFFSFKSALNARKLSKNRGENNRAIIIMGIAFLLPFCLIIGPVAMFIFVLLNV